MRCWKSIYSVQRETQTQIEAEQAKRKKGRPKERRSTREEDGQKEAVDLQKHYWRRQNVAERRACT